MATFAGRIKSIRNEKKLSLDEMANILGTSKQVLSRYEREERYPKITTVKQYANRLNVDAAWLLGYDDVTEQSTDQKWLMNKIAKADEKSLSKLKKLMELIDAEEDGDSV